MRNLAGLLCVAGIGVGMAGFVTLLVLTVISALALDLLVEIFDDA